MNFDILGIGTATPPFHVVKEAAVKIAASFCRPDTEQQRLLAVLYRRSGVNNRGSVVLESAGTSVESQSFFLPATSPVDGGPTTAARMERYAAAAPVLALAAARAALENAQTAAADITHLITVSCSGFRAPGFDIDLIRNLPLSSDVARTHLGFMGCHAALNGLRIARAFAAASPSARVLLCAVETCTLHMQYGWDPDRVITNAIFADGAAALVGGIASGREQSWTLAGDGSTLIPDSTSAMCWEIGDHGFRMLLSPKVPDLIRQHLRPWLEKWLGTQGLRLDEVRSWAIHPGGPRILQACAEGAGLAPNSLEVSQQVLAEFGNMSSPTVLFILERLRERHSGLPCVALGFGPGMALEAALFR